MDRLAYVVLAVGAVLLLLGARQDGLAMREYGFYKTERAERFGNWIRAGSLLVTSSIVLLWVLLSGKESETLYPHFVTLAVAASVIMVWGAIIEHRRWKRFEAPRRTRLAAQFGTPGLFMLQIGWIIWAMSNPWRFDSFESAFGTIVLCVLVLSFSMFALLFLTWRTYRDRSPDDR
jgi:uncharacterized membrane-anchored protein